MDDERPVLIGMNNPLSDDPRLALWPSPERSAGYRLWKMLNDRCGVDRLDYIRGFDRRNLVIGPWSTQAARAAARGMRQALEGRTVVLLGAGVADAMCGDGMPLIHPVRFHGATYRALPHPSGRNHWYNDETNRALAAMLLAELYEGSDR